MEDEKSTDIIETAETVDPKAAEEEVKTTVTEGSDESAEETGGEEDFEVTVAKRITAVEESLAKISAWVDEQIAATQKKKEALKGFFAPVPKERENELKGRITADDVRTIKKTYV